jgi:hypothetical protein
MPVQDGKYFNKQKKEKKKKKESSRVESFRSDNNIYYRLDRPF